MVFSRLLRFLGASKSILKGKIVHGHIITSGFRPDVYSTNHLISMYVKFEHLEDARQLLDQMPERNLVSWTLLISGYSNAGLSEDALRTFSAMITQGYDPNSFTYVGIISACASIKAARTGKEIHGRLYRVEEDLNSFVCNSLVNMYAKCGMIEIARRVFDGILHPDLVAWTSILSGYCQCGENEEALRVFLRSRRVGVKANEFAFASVLGASADLVELRTGKQMHCCIIKSGFRLDRFIATGMVNLYAKCCELDDAHRAFMESGESGEPGLATWTALIGGYAQHGKGHKAISLFRTLHSLGLKPNEHTFSSILSACANVIAVKEGKQFHAMILKSGFKLITFVGNAIVDLYAKCGCLDESSKVFQEMEERDVVSWNVLIAGHVQIGHFGEVVHLLDQMFLDGLRPNIYSYSSILSLCGDLPAIGWGKQTHGCILKPGFDKDVVVGSALIDMYAKCGRLNDAHNVFNRLNVKTVVSWNTILVGYAQHGFGKEALGVFREIERDGIKPNDITFLGVLLACGHVGLVEDGQRYFDSMIKDHNIIPSVDHVACMVDLFARGGQVERAYEFIVSMPVEPDKVVWRSLLASCKTYKHLALGRYAAEQILRIDPEDVSAYIMLSSIYADAEMWDEMAQVRQTMKEKGLKKDPGCSWIEVNNMVHSFIARDTAHCQREIILETVNGLTVQMFDHGYIPSSISLHDGEYVKE
ncbi:hypothetical protein MRB53_004443 [Persea americana]|uniref:Uncharacterized protein n=1 Tax=Persea americana TaxID=3435 RepID=A0ACC2MAJ7_PERAE|nr:hypothetical protein MRB53_004443 [Persea americana]